MSVCVMDVWSEVHTKYVWDIHHACLQSISLWGWVLHANL